MPFFVIQRSELYLFLQAPCGRRRRFRPRSLQLGKRLPQSDQAADKVAAVHRGDVPGRERAKGAGIVPVVEISLPLFQLFYRGKGAFRPVEHPLVVDQPEIPGGGDTQKIQPDVGGGGAVGHPPYRGFLHVIRGKVVLGGGAVFLIIPPHGGGVGPHPLLLAGGEGTGVPGRNRPGGYDGEREEKEEDQSAQPGKAAPKHQQEHRDQQRGPESPERLAPTGAAFLRLGGGGPFQHPSAGKQTGDRPAGPVRAGQRRGGKHREGIPCLGQRPHRPGENPGIIPAAQGHPAPLEQGEQRGQQVPRDRREQSGQRQKLPRSPVKKGGEQQAEKAGRRSDRTPDVVGELPFIQSREGKSVVP